MSELDYSTTDSTHRQQEQTVSGDGGTWAGIACESQAGKPGGASDWPKRAGIGPVRVAGGPLDVKPSTGAAPEDAGGREIPQPLQTHSGRQEGCAAVALPDEARINQGGFHGGLITGHESDSTIIYVKPYTGKGPLVVDGSESSLPSGFEPLPLPLPGEPLRPEKPVYYGEGPIGLVRGPDGQPLGFGSDQSYNSAQPRVSTDTTPPAVQADGSGTRNPNEQHVIVVPLHRGPGHGHGPVQPVVTTSTGG